MPEFTLQIASRHLRRAFERAVRHSVPKILTELITNADDSYRRLAEVAARASVPPDHEDPGPITIMFDRDRRRFAVIDHAEGITDREMEEQFVTYGQESGDRARGFRTRSLFGKGLRDVLFTQQYGQVKSIKDGRFYNCRFRWKDVEGQERPVVDIKPPSRATAELREALGIPRNGTCVEFCLASGLHNPQPEKLVERLSRFYMLRMINSSPHREVLLNVMGAKSKVTGRKQLSYVFPEFDVRDRIEEDMAAEDGTIVSMKGTIGLSDRELTQGEVGYEDREGGILVLDEDDAVLDLCLFGFDEDPSARRLVGILKLNGAGDYIRRKLNQEHPEEILTETRDGFDKNHPFYRLLRDRIQPRLAPIVASLREQGPRPKVMLSERTQERHKQAFEILNRLYSSMLGKTGRVPVLPASRLVPPPEGIAFANSHISVQVGVPTPAALLINTAVVQPNEAVELKSDQADIEVFPPVVTSSELPEASAVQVKIVRIHSVTPNINGNVSASWKGRRTVLEVSTTNREVLTPVNGLEFDRDEYAVRLRARRNLGLFVDTEKIPLEATIVVTAEGSALRVIDRQVVVETATLVTARIAQVHIAVTGVDLAKGIMVTASAKEFVAGTRVSVVKKAKKDLGKAGIFKNYDFRPIERKVQSLFDPQGLILINTKDPVNARYFGSEPYRAVEEHAHCQVRLADLILNECLQMMVSEALENGKLDRRFPNNPEIDIRYYVDEQKYEIGPLIHKLFVTAV